MIYTRRQLPTRIAAAFVAAFVCWEVASVQQKTAAPLGRAVRGCGNVEEHHLQHASLNRSYLVYRPCKTAPRAILLSIHCFGCDATQQTEPFIPHAEQYGFVVLSPVGVEHSFNANRYCCGHAMEEKLDDRGFIKSLADRENMQQKLQVFSFGFSNGGYMSSDLAIAHPGWLSGVAMASGHNYEDLHKLASTPVMLLWKEHDSMVRYNGCCSTQMEEEACCCGISMRAPQNCVNTQGIFEAWQRANNCKSSSKPLQLMDNASAGVSSIAEDGEAESRGDARCVQGGACSQSTVLCTYAGSLHTQWATPPAFIARRVAVFFNDQLSASTTVK